MAFPLGHFAAALLAGYIMQVISRTKFSKRAWLILLIGSILPDLDLFFDYFFGWEIHRTFTHSLLFLLIFTAFGLAIDKDKQIGWMLGLGIFTHLFLDLFAPLGVQFLWPLPYTFSIWGIAQNTIHQFPVIGTDVAYVSNQFKRAMWDMSIGAAMFLWYSFWGRISFAKS